MAAPLVCLLIHYRSFFAWFRADDFAWFGFAQNVHGPGDLLAFLFQPYAQGTIRPWSERLFFFAGFHLFGLNPIPYRVLIFGTQFANLALAASIGARITGRRAAGLLAAIFWAVHCSALEPLGWVCVFNQVLCAFGLLLAFHCWLRFFETGERRFEIATWVVFVLGFGAQELNLVFPALAAAWSLAAGRKYLRRTIPMFAVSAAYVAAHIAFAPLDRAGGYAMHFTGAIFRTLARYWTWTAGPSLLWTPWSLPEWVVLTGVAAVSFGLLAFLWTKRTGPAAFCIAWYVIALAPILPLRDHRMQYYLFVPAIGICWLGGWAVAEAWDRGLRVRAAAAALAVLYLAMILPRTVASADWNYRLTMRVRNLIESVNGARQVHPGKTIMLEGVDADLFINAFVDHSFRLVGIDRVYLAPEAAGRIPAMPDIGDPAEFMLPAEVVHNALDRGELVVYDASGPQLRNTTTAYAARPRESTVPKRVDAANPLTEYLLGPGWYPAENNHRWMSKRASLRIGGPGAAGQRLYVQGVCPEDQLRAGPLGVAVTVNGTALPAAEIRPGQTGFELSWALPDGLVGKPAVEVTVEVARTIRPGAEARDLGLAFGVFTVK